MSNPRARRETIGAKRLAACHPERSVAKTRNLLKDSSLTLRMTMLRGQETRSFTPLRLVQDDRMTMLRGWEVGAIVVDMILGNVWKC